MPDGRVLGIDVSSYQSGIAWQKAADSGVAFEFIKATEGTSLVDRRFALCALQKSSSPIQ
jgi:lysozyme